MRNYKHITFYRNTAWQYGLQVVKYLFPLITLPYLTRVLEPDGYAVYAYVLSLMTFAQVFIDFGFNLSGTKQIAAAVSVKDENYTIGAITQARLVLCVVSGLVVCAVASLIPITATNLDYTMLAFAAVCGRAMAPDFVFQGHEDMRPITVRYFVSKGISTALTFVFVKSVADLMWIPVLDILASAIALAWSFATSKRLFGTVIMWVTMRRVLSELRDSALYCFSNMAASVFSGFTTLLIGVVVPDAAQISYWSLAMTAVSAVQSLYSPIVDSMYPHMVRSCDFGFVMKTALVALPTILAGTVFFVDLRDIIVLVLGGEAYLEGTWILVAVSPVLLFSFFAMLFGWPVLGAAGRVREVTSTTVGSGIFCITALLVVSFLGMATMPIICGIRVITEVVLCLSRVWFCRTLVFKSGARLRHRSR
ncbi:oligosaccharide flippase family protein [Adlercreutzia sp. ZJ141]|uniref:oligosaccharide flippase family protein n=1 Tax=Adlercreutzia sp. ZJ141 TaxID=2709406 RepID=UPI0013EAD836|nr:oligosaccharide flippase family protein [Adlercreutzia sp. ZJ141]